MFYYPQIACAGKELRFYSFIRRVFIEHLLQVRLVRCCAYVKEKDRPGSYSYWAYVLEARDKTHMCYLKYKNRGDRVTMIRINPSFREWGVALYLRSKYVCGC